MQNSEGNGSKHSKHLKGAHGTEKCVSFANFPARLRGFSGTLDLSRCPSVVKTSQNPVRIVRMWMSIYVYQDVPYFPFFFNPDFLYDLRNFSRIYMMKIGVFIWKIHSRENKFCISRKMRVTLVYMYVSLQWSSNVCFWVLPLFLLALSVAEDRNSDLRKYIRLKE